MKIAEGDNENGVVIGNTYDKYGSRNLIVRQLMHGFESALSQLIAKADPTTIHEVGCGEGYWVLRWLELGLSARGSDFSERVIELARSNANRRQLDPSVFVTRSIYNLDIGDSADLIVCCEVLEHLERPEDALRALQKITIKNLVLSVPREPIWCALNMVRGKYLSDWGNTPGHIQHWSKAGFVNLISQYFEVQQIKSPFPWTMLLCRPYR